MPLLTTLPQETLYHIFRDLVPGEILHVGKVCKLLQSHSQDRYLWLSKAIEARDRTPNLRHYRPPLTTFSTGELKRDAFREVWVDSGWKADGFKPAYMKSFPLCQPVSNPIILPGGDFILLSSLDGGISLRKIDNFRWEMALKEVASHRLQSAGGDFTIRAMHTDAGVIIAGTHAMTGIFTVELLHVITSPPLISLIKTVKVCESAEAAPVATCAQANIFACLVVTAAQQLRVLVTTIFDPENDPELDLALNQEVRPYGHTICMPSPKTIIVCDGPTICMYNIPDYNIDSVTGKTRHTIGVNHIWEWINHDPKGIIPLTPNIIFWNESKPPTLRLASENCHHVLTFDTIGNSSRLDVRSHYFKPLETEEIGERELRRFISKGEKGLLCHEDSITPGQILRTITLNDPDFNIHYVRLYHENFWSSGLEDYWIEDLDFDEVSGRMVFQCGNPEEEEPYKIFIADMV